MQQSRRDTQPARYVGLGVLILTSADGTRHDFGLYTPGGHCSDGDEYFVADFSGLKAHCEKVNPAVKSFDITMPE